MVQNDIATKQNEQTFLDCLAAQRCLYTRTKRLCNLLFIICVLIPVVLAIAKIMYPSYSYIPKIIVVYSFTATLVGLWLKDIVTKKKVLAACIQQFFDCELFSLDWNRAHCGNKPKPEEIHSAIHNASYDKLKDWYEPIVSQLPLSVGALVCMRTNVVYDQSLRKSYATVCYIATLFAILSIIVMGMLNNTGMWDAFLYGIVPIMPLITWLIDFRKQHKANLKALDNIDVLIESGFKEAFDKHDVSRLLLDEVQNFIFLHRKFSYLIPDVFYKIARSRNETTAYYGASEICKRYKLL